MNSKPVFTNTLYVSWRQTNNDLTQVKAVVHRDLPKATLSYSNKGILAVYLNDEDDFERVRHFVDTMSCFGNVVGAYGLDLPKCLLRGWVDVNHPQRVVVGVLDNTQQVRDSVRANRFQKIVPRYAVATKEYFENPRENIFGGEYSALVFDHPLSVVMSLVQDDFSI
jgi:hypothetical protein